MSKSLTYKLLLILGVVVVAALFSFPPKDRINLGLDLRGGSHILMQVDIESAVRYESDRVVTSLGQVLKTDAITYASIVAPSPGTIEIKGTDPSRRADVRDRLNRIVRSWDISETDPGGFRATMPSTYRKSVEVEAVERTLATIGRRIDSLGVGERQVSRAGMDGTRILIELPGVEDPTRVKDILQDPALLEWKAVTVPPSYQGDAGSWHPPASREELVAQFGGALPDDTEVFPQDVQMQDGSTTAVFWPLKRVSTVAGADLRNAGRSSDQWGDPAVSFELTQDAGKRFEMATRENMGRKMAIVLGGPSDKRVISAPVIEGVIRDQGIIRGGFSVEQAEDLALKLRSGSIPTDVRIIEERTVGPSLGRDSIRAGIVSGLAGIGAVFLFMVVYYKFSGINAVVALLLNVLLIFGCLGALPFLFGNAGIRATLTLPGIAGLILSIGMAVDSNVLVFERIREELGLGKTVRSAIEQGFSKAFATILDTHVTTVVSALFLGFYGTGPVRGFAVTLIIGLVASMFTAVFVSHRLFDLVLARNPSTETLSI
jgi:preprotein translocase subunit SecD